MKRWSHMILIGLIALLLASGCSVFPGARVLFGQTDSTVAAATVGDVELVMADKTSLIDPSLTAAADRVEAANGGSVDIIEIRQDSENRVLTVYMLLNIPSNASNLEQISIIKRAVELTWQGMMRESEGMDSLDIEVVAPSLVPTLDNGLSFLGQVVISSQISRENAIQYLNSRPHSESEFVNMVIQGVVTFDSPAQTTYYEGQPNHPVFMLAQMLAEAKNQANTGS